MKRYIQHEFLKVSHLVTSEWQHPVHNHNHFEVIFVHRGKGLHCLSGMCYPYRDGSLFLLAPCDYHSFEIEAETEFTFLKFTNVYLNGVGNIEMRQRWNQEMDQLLVQARSRHLPILESMAEEARVDGLMRMIGAEWKETKNEANETIYFLVQAILSIIRRNTQTAFMPGPMAEEGAMPTLAKGAARA